MLQPRQTQTSQTCTSSGTPLGLNMSEAMHKSALSIPTTQSFMNGLGHGEWLGKLEPLSRTPSGRRSDLLVL